MLVHLVGFIIGIKCYPVFEELLLKIINFNRCQEIWVIRLRVY